ncbi:MAG: SDR family oxidoreductase [Candidatus Contendobacter sp.]|nr:SDR family oxidoreductase [Candidatus Contendobacter sp.]
MQPVKTYFVTGATGVVGSALVPLLLEDAGTRVKLLIRSDSPDDVTARLEALFGFWEVTPDNLDFRGRVQALRGDVTAPRFGLDETAYGELCADCTHIVHAAGNVRMNLPLEKARLSAVGSARNVVEFARVCPLLEKIEFVSTVGVGGRVAGSVPERWLTEPRPFHNTYEQAKAEAECYVQREVERGLPLTVHRPSMVVGDSLTGKVMHFQIFYHLCDFLSGRLTLGLYPYLGTALLDIIPADYVARAIAWSSLQTITTGEILHLCSGPERALRLEALREVVRSTFAEAGLRLPPAVPVPRMLFGASMRLLGTLVRGENRRRLRALPVFLEYLATEQTFDNARTQSLLKSAELAVPPPATYLNCVLKYFRARQNR